MKLRIDRNSIRLRLLRSEVTAFLETGRVEHTLHLAPEAQSIFHYRLEHEPDLASVEVRPKPSEIVIVVPAQQAEAWALTEQIGIYATVDLGRHGSLEIMVEKDFACLDLSDADNHDTFPNPQIGAVC